MANLMGNFEILLSERTKTGERNRKKQKGEAEVRSGRTKETFIN